MNILLNEPLAPYTSLNVGGNAEKLIIIDHKDEMIEALHNSETKPWMLGFGCNVLISDRGLPGTTLVWRSGNITVSDTELVATAGIWWDDVVKASIEQGLWGLELMSEIPSSVGGAVYGNIAAYGQQVSDTLSWIEVFDFSSKEIKRFKKEDFDFKYRWSSLQNNPELFILQAGFSLSKEPTHELKYDSALAIANELDIEPNILENCRAIIVETRKQAGSIYHPGEIGYEHTAGSFFKNPLVSTEQARQLATFDETGKTLERIENQSRIHGGDSHRASAAHVLLAAGFARGQTWGRVRLHPKHVLKIETLPGASAQEVYSAVTEIIATVKKSLDIDIEPEVKFLGHF